jgi:hypothetical protein
MMSSALTCRHSITPTLAYPYMFMFGMLLLLLPLLPCCCWCCQITPKNILMVGPTGCGKTEIARRLAKLVEAPFVKVGGGCDWLVTATMCPTKLPQEGQTQLLGVSALHQPPGTPHPSAQQPLAAPTANPWY